MVSEALEVHEMLLMFDVRTKGHQIPFFVLISFS